MDDRQYVYLPTSAVNGGSVCVGYPYSLLDWVPEPNASWSLSVGVRRIASNESAKSVGVEQIQALNETRKDSKGALDIVAGDGSYGNAGFLRPLQGLRCGLVVRLREDRVLYRAPDDPEIRKRGRPKIHGKRFTFKEPETWGDQDEIMEFEHDHWRQVRLERWNGLHGKLDVDVPLNIVCFRYVQPGRDQESLNSLNQEILMRLHERGLAAPTYTRLQGKFALRVSVTNHRTIQQDLDFLLEKVGQIAAELIAVLEQSIKPGKYHAVEQAEKHCVGVREGVVERVPFGCKSQRLVKTFDFTINAHH